MSYAKLDGWGQYNLVMIYHNYQGLLSRFIGEEGENGTEKKKVKLEKKTLGNNEFMNGKIQ